MWLREGEFVMRTRVKICGITREQDAVAVAQAGADALGFVFYQKSPRAVSGERAAVLCRELPPFLTRVGLFVNPSAAEVNAVLDQCGLHLLQFHGDESAEFCASFGRPWMKAARMKPGVDLVEFAARFAGADGVLCDAFVDGYGGAGQVFDWSLLPDAGQLSRPLVLSGGLDADNVGEAIRRVCPAAVDVSSGVELAKGIKDAAKINAFIEKVRHADEVLRSA